MPYIGHGVTNAGTFYVIDDLTMSSSTTYTLQVGGVSVTPKADNLLITLDGVVQHTPDAYTVSGSTLTFASAPGSGVDFYGIIMGQSASTGQGSIGADELKVTGDGSANQFLAGDGDGTFTFKDGTLSTTTTTGDIIYRANSSALARLGIGSTGQVLTVANGVPAWSTDTEAYLPSAGGTMSGNIAMGGGDISGGGTITGTFVGGITGNVTGNASGSSGSTTGNAATATALANARTIGGTSFDGTANIAVGLAATATTLATARAINGVDFDGSAAITVTAAAGTLSGTELKSTVVTSSLTSVGTLTALTGGTGDFNWDSNTLVVDSSESRVGIGTASPESALHVVGTIEPTPTIGGVHIGTSDAGGSNYHAMLQLAANNGAAYIDFSNIPEDVDFRIIETSDGASLNIIAGTTATDGISVKSDGNVGIGTTPDSDCKLDVAGGDIGVNANHQIKFSTAGDDAWGMGAMHAANGPFSSIPFSDYVMGVWGNGPSSHPTRGFFVGNAAEESVAMTVLFYSGNVGIGTTAPSYPLEANGMIVSKSSAVNEASCSSQNSDGDTLYLTSYQRSNAGNIFGMAKNGLCQVLGLPNVGMIVGTHTNTPLYLGVNNTVEMTIATNGVISGDFNDTSDESKKENIKTLTSGLTGINALNPVTFDWKEEYVLYDELDELPEGKNLGDIKRVITRKGQRSGFIAQEVETIESLANNVVGEDGSKAINTSGLLAHAVKAIQELSAKVTALENA